MEEKKEQLTDAPENPGAMMARAAIQGMAADQHAKEDAEKAARERKKAHDRAVDESAEAFLKECRESGSNPFKVVERVAADNGIRLTGDAPEDPDKCRVYEVLKVVVHRVVEEMLEEDRGRASDTDDAFYRVFCLMDLALSGRMERMFHAFPF